MPKAKGSKRIVVDELDAWDYAAEDAEFQHWEETLVKEGKEIPTTKGKPEPTSTPDEKPKKVVKTKEASSVTPREPVVDLTEEEIVLEPVDDWEAAMDALDAKVAQEEAKKSQQRK